MGEGAQSRAKDINSGREREKVNVYLREREREREMEGNELKSGVNITKPRNWMKQGKAHKQKCSVYPVDKKHYFSYHLSKSFSSLSIVINVTLRQLYNKIS